MKIAVAGATGKTGRHLVARLCSDGHRVVALGRDPARFAAVDSRADRRLADFADARALAAALEGAEAVVNCAEARFTEAVLAALPPDCRRLVLTDTMRRFLAEPDEPGRHAAHAETALDWHLRAHPGRTGIIVHFGMIYGPPDDANVERILAVVRRWPSWLPLIAPLPGGGRATVQPIYMDDAVETLRRALDRDDSGPPITAAGPSITYAEMVRHCARARPVLGRPGDARRAAGAGDQSGHAPALRSQGMAAHGRKQAPKPRSPPRPAGHCAAEFCRGPRGQARASRSGPCLIPPSPRSRPRLIPPMSDSAHV